MNRLVTETNELLKDGGFEYTFCGGQGLDLFLGYESRVHGDIDVCAYWEDRDRIIRHMQSRGFTVYEMLGGGRAHHITDVSDQIRKKKNIFCFREGCPLVKTYPPDEDGCCWMEFFHIGQTEPDFVEFLFNDRSQDAFEYARNREITRETEKAVLFRDGVPYLAPELCLLYKSTDIEREGYQQDFELAYPAMDPPQREWLRKALLREYPKGHPWLDVLQTEQLILRFADEGDLAEVARTWPSDHRPVSGEEAQKALAGMRGNYARNTVGHIYHLCLAVCGKEDPRTIMGWCGLDGSRNPEEPEIFILLDEAYRNQGYGTQCVRELLRTAAEDYGLQSVHGGCDKSNIASKRAMEKGGMAQYGTEDNGDPLFRFAAKEGKYTCKVATAEEMVRKWDYEISLHAEKENWLAWKDEAIENARAGRSIPYYGILDGTIICEATANLFPDFPPAGGEKLTGKTVELCAFRTNREYRGKGYFSRLMDFMQEDLKRRGYDKAVVGVEPGEKRNREIYQHWGFTEYTGSTTETYPDGTAIEVMLFGKQL